MKKCENQEVVFENSGIERLSDSKFAWVERRRDAMELADIYQAAAEMFDVPEYAELARRAGSCGTWLEFNEVAGGGGEIARRSLRAANFCCLRICPMCVARRARRAAIQLSRVMDKVEVEYGCKFLFLTLTIRNVAGEDLGDALSLLTSGWTKFIRHRAFERAVGGWFRAIEITYNRERQDYHPHIHAILAVPQEYGEKDNPLYIAQAEWIRHWRVAAGLDYDPSVRISRSRSRRRVGGDDAASQAASKEAAKYCTKSSDYIDSTLSIEQSALIVHHYTQALYKRRLTGFGGWLKAAASDLRVEDLDKCDLIHADDDVVRDDLADYIAVYGWSLGVGDYILKDRYVNPLF